MKTYQSGTKETKKNFFKRHKYAIALIVSVLVVATVIVLSVVFTLPEKVPVSNGDVVVDPPNSDVVTGPVITNPMKNATVGMEYYDDKLVKWETLDLWQWHPAVDFVGSGDVYAIMDGKVLDVEKTTIDGNVVTIEHADGYVSIYKSLGSDIAVKKGDTVKSGDKIGTSSTSMMSELNTGDHMHFELKQNGKYVNPSALLDIDSDK
ncbi:MAG: peptidoglycan DD-metalloendopeptidase family protein [Clostridiales bacterium]|nr:peptidoglycan DD-metalloendopeptidase family protein [Clostridiales bacterium]